MCTLARQVRHRLIRVHPPRRGRAAGSTRTTCPVASVRKHDADSESEAPSQGPPRRRCIKQVTALVAVSAGAEGSPERRAARRVRARRATTWNAPSRLAFTRVGWGGGGSINLSRHGVARRPVDVGRPPGRRRCGDGQWKQHRPVGTGTAEAREAVVASAGQSIMGAALG